MHTETETKTRTRPLMLVSLILALAVILEAGAFVFAKDIRRLWTGSDGETTIETNAPSLENATLEDNLSAVLDSFANSVPGAHSGDSNASGELTNVVGELLNAPELQEGFKQLMRVTCVIAFYPETTGFANDGVTITEEELSQARESCLGWFTREAIDADRDLALKDSDGDEYNDLAEAVTGTDPDLRDTDGDGYDDLTEIRNAHNPLAAPSAE